jgi:enamine deaminase RidA (YjgF/YER057c/UK114 family)
LKSPAGLATIAGQNTEAIMADARRQQSIEVENIGHAAPIPVACRVGNTLATSAIGGRDLKTGKLPPDGDTQARNAFESLKVILAKGGMGLGDVIKITCFVTDDNPRVDQQILERVLPRRAQAPGAPHAGAAAARRRAAADRRDGRRGLISPRVSQ